MKSGFTIVELLVSIGIFVMMTALVITKYGNFNQNVFLTNLAYDVALTIRTAQTFGISVRSPSDTILGASSFQYPYGIHFDKSSLQNQKVILFADTNQVSPSQNTFTAVSTPDDAIINTYNIKRGAIIDNIYVGISGSSCSASTNTLDILFKRPDPTALICVGGDCATYKCANVVVKGTDGGTRTIQILSNGQVSVVE